MDAVVAKSSIGGSLRKRRGQATATCKLWVNVTDRYGVT